MAVKQDGSDSPPENKGKLSLSQITGAFGKKEKEVGTEKKGGSEGPVKAKGAVPTNRVGAMLKGSWIAKNWQTTMVLIMILGLAFFIRVYFAYPLSVDNGFLVSGGSDSYYHMRVIDHVVSTGQHLVFDDMLNYPSGMRNARPPLYDWSVAVTGMGLNAVFGIPQSDAVGYSLVFSTAFWGMMTIIPVFLLANAAFGRKAGLIAGFLFALMPGHIERSVFSNADHDAIVLFFVVFSFYFLLRALQSIKGTKWVTKWTDPKAVRDGGRSFVQSNGLTLVYAALAGVCTAAVAMTWTGYTYLLIIALVFLMVQLLVDRFRNADSTGVVASFAVMWTVAFAIMAPVYYLMNYWQVWFDVPFYLFLIGLVIGAIFIVTRDLPWTIVLPTVAVLAVVGLFALSFLAPTLFNAVVSGQGYLVKSKLYATISEAQPPSISNFIMSFGAVTFWLALVGLVYAVVKIPKTTGPYMVFLVVWAATSIYMASSAGRFLFNASPVFAVLGGWILALIVDRIDFVGYFHELALNVKSPKVFLRKLASFQVVIVVLLIGITIMLPNVWTAFDASIPSQDKRTYDKQIYEVMPDFLHPNTAYDRINGSYWYLGGFSYSMPLPETYWPTAWRWYSEQNNNLTEEERPAFLSWWDYGFEAVQEGRHPTVADNFQNGYQFAGTFITAQNETQSIAMFIVRNAEKMIRDQQMGLANYDTYWAAMSAAGVNMTQFFDVMDNPADYTDYVLGHPEIFGPFDQDISPANTKYVMASYVLSSVGQETLVDLYHQQRDVTGYDIGYFAIDGRLFPFTATSYNIFYAPVTLADRRVDSNNIPIDFYEIKAVDQYGNEYSPGDIPKGTVIVDYSITYKDMFYKCMLYRAFMGYGPADVGKTQQGIPGVSGSLASLPSMQAWNMTHYRVVYRTAYFNPFPENQTALHGNDWRAVSYVEALDLQAAIDNGTMNGTVDMSTIALSQGVVFIQYYDGVIIRGKALSEDNQPIRNIWVTVQDEFGTPHNTVKTDAEGNYEVIAPFGPVSLKFSWGTLDLRTQVGTLITTKNFNFTYDQAMRRSPASSSTSGLASADSSPDWIIDQNVTIEAGNIHGVVFQDTNRDGSYQPLVDVLLDNATVYLKDTTSTYTQQMVATNGAYSFTGIPPMKAEIYAMYQGHKIGLQTISIVPRLNTTINLGVAPSTLSVTVLTPWNTPAQNLAVDLIDQANGQVTTLSTSSTGGVSFTNLFPGNYDLRANNSALHLNAGTYSVAEKRTYVEKLIVYDAMTIGGKIIYGPSGTDSVPYARIGFINPTYTQWTSADVDGNYAVTLPRLNYSIYVISNVNGKQAVNLVQQPSANAVDRNITIWDGLVYDGYVIDLNKTVVGASLVVNNSMGGMITSVTNSDGSFHLVLPDGSYSVYAVKGQRVVWSQLPGDGSNITLGQGNSVSGKVWIDLSHDGLLQTNEGLANVTIDVKDEVTGRHLTVVSDPTGAYSAVLPTNGTYTFTVDQAKYEPVIFTYNDLNTNQTRNIELVPTNRTLSGTVDLGGTGLGNVVVHFISTAGWGNNTTVTTDPAGLYQVSLRPGTYSLRIDQNLTLNDESVQYQLVRAQTVTLGIGQAPTTLPINATVRYKVSGTVSSTASDPFSAKISFNAAGSDSVTLSTNGSYSNYLQKGNYSIYVLSDVVTNKEVYFGLVVVSGAMTLDLTTVPANRASINVRYDGLPLLSNVPVDITDPTSKAVYSTVTTPTGSANIYMPAGGVYNLTVEYRTLAKPVPTAEDKKYLLFQADQSIYFNETQNVNVPLSQSYDNSTVTGLPTGATVQFHADSTTAISLTFQTTSSTAQVAPGNYTVYANDTAGNAFLGFVTVQPHVSNDLGVALVSSYLVNGTISVGGTPTSGEVTIVQGNSALMLDTDPYGVYRIVLPAGTYTENGAASVQENGMAVLFTGTASFTVTGAMQNDLPLNRDVQYGVKMSWNNVKGNVSNGQPITYTIILTNTGNMVDSYEVSSGTLNWNVTFSYLGVSNQTKFQVENLTFGTAGSVAFDVTLIPSFKVNVVHTSVFLTASSTGGTGARSSLSIDANIVPRNDVNLTYLKALPQSGKDNYTYSILVENVGNQDDQYKVDLLNAEALQAKGWNATIRLGTTGNFTVGSLTFNLTAGRNNTIQVTLVKIDQNASTDINVSMSATSILHQNSDQLDFVPQFSDPSVPDDGFSVSGKGVAFKMPDLSNETMALIAACAGLAALLVFLMIRKGVLLRKKH